MTYENKTVSGEGKLWTTQTDPDSIICHWHAFLAIINQVAACTDSDSNS